MKALNWKVLGSLAAATLLAACVSDAGSQTSPLDSESCPVGPRGCISCVQLIYELNDVCDEADLCSESMDLHVTCTDCMCDRCGEACAERCGDQRVDPSQACADCMLDHCTDEVQACVSDLPR